MLKLGAPQTSDYTRVLMLGSQIPVKWYRSTRGIAIDLPIFTPASMPCQWAWVIKMINLVNMQ